MQYWDPSQSLLKGTSSNPSLNNKSANIPLSLTEFYNISQNQYQINTFLKQQREIFIENINNNNTNFSFQHNYQPFKDSSNQIEIPSLFSTILFTKTISFYLNLYNLTNLPFLLNKKIFRTKSLQDNNIFKFVTYNTKGINKQTNQNNIFQEYKKLKIDILGLCETKLTSKSATFFF